MRKMLVQAAGLLLIWSPCLIMNPVTENITGLQNICLPVYILWGFLVLFLLFRSFDFGPWMVLLAAGFLCPYIPAAGMINDLHIWLQIAGIGWLSVSELQNYLRTAKKRTETYFLVLGVSLAAAGFSGHVSGVAEMLFASGILLFCQPSASKGA